MLEAGLLISLAAIGGTLFASFFSVLYTGCLGGGVEIAVAVVEARTGDESTVSLEVTCVLLRVVEVDVLVFAIASTSALVGPEIVDLPGVAAMPLITAGEEESVICPCCKD